jgi:hypothetical protein
MRFSLTFNYFFLDAILRDESGWAVYDCEPNVVLV